MRAKLVEMQNFRRGQNPYIKLGIGEWKMYDDIIVPLEVFKKNGGILKEGRDLYDDSNIETHIGVWIGFDDKQNIDLMRNYNYTSIPVTPDAGVKVETQVRYK